ncbi:hypothetical protein [Jatrophihabitans endophyticus]|uniref:hypothetical protein n=1 Tax=Jatrophihabitans endophyticus TaxID=1206085 RepID=UPI0011612F5B|nr:hypothetical protein [Jatrophihabitans endophyticus]
MAYLSLDDSAWARTIRQARRDLDALRHERDIDVRVRVDDNGAQAQLAAIRAELDQLRARSRTDIRFRNNARQTRSDIGSIGSSADSSRSRVGLLFDAIVLLGSAAAPLAAVGGGILAGLVPTLASTALGIAGISDMAKSGALDISRYGDDVTTLKQELTTLKAVTAVPLLDGLESGLANSAPLFKVINTDAHQMAGQIGEIASNAGPALLNILTQLDPLFASMGAELVRGSNGLERWAASSTGVQDFVAYVQAELPNVEQTLGNLLETIVHVGQGAGPMGHVTLEAISAVSSAINSLPLPVLRAIVPLLVAWRVASLGLRATTAVVGAIGSAYTQAAGRAQAMGATSMAASLEMRSASAAAAAQVAADNLAQAESALTAARAQQGASASFIASKAEEVAAARAAAIQTAAAAEASAARTVAAGRVAAMGWRAALGPIGALVLILGSLAFAMGDSSDETDDATKANQNYTESVKQSTDALSNANLQATAKTLQDNNALKVLDRLHAGNQQLGTSYGTLANAVNGSKSDFDQLYQSLLDIAGLDKLPDNLADLDKGGQKLNETQKAAVDLADKLRTTRASLHENIDAQKAYNQAQSESVRLAAGGSPAQQAMARALNMTGAEYLAATKAAKQNTDQTNAQAQAMRVASDAAGLLDQAFKKLNGETLDIADARIAQANSLATLTKGLKDNATAWSLSTEAGRNNQQNVNSAIRSAQALGEAVSGGSKMTRKGIEATREALTQERARLKAMGASAGAIRRVDRALSDLNKIPAKKIATTVDTTTAQARIRDLTAKVNAIKQGKVPGVTANTAVGKALIARLNDQINSLQQNRVPQVSALTGPAESALQRVQNYLNALHDKSVNVTVHHNGTVSTGGDSGRSKGGQKFEAAKGGPVHRAAGGDVGMVYGPGTGTSDDVPAMLVDGSYRQPYRLSNGEWISTADATKRNRSALEAANRGATLDVVAMAAGGRVGQITTTRGSGKKDKADYRYGGKTYDTITAAQNARATDIKAVLKLTTQIDTKGLRAFSDAVDGTTSQARAAFRRLYDQMDDAGASDRALAHLRKLDAALLTHTRRRDALRAQLGSPSRSNSTAYDKLEAARSAYSSTYTQARDAARGTFNVASAGVTDQQATPTFGSMQAAARQQALLVTKYVAGVRALAKKLGKSQTGRAMLQQIIDAGPGAYPQVRALLSASASDLSSLVSSQRTINERSSAFGTFAADTFNKAGVTTAQRRVNDLKRDIAAEDRRADRTARVMAKAARAELRNIKLDIYMDGKKVGTASRKGNKKNDRRR